MSADPVRAFLDDELPAVSVELEPHQRITDAVIVMRIEDMEDGAEAYTYTTTPGVHRAACLGLLDIAMDQVMNPIGADE